MKRTALVLSVAFCLIFLSTVVFAEKPTDNKSFGQTVYVPATYNVYPNSQLLITRIVIRNIDPGEKITVKSIAFYSPDGDFVIDLLESAAVEIESWSSKSYATDDATLGVPPYFYNVGNPCFIVKWEAEDKVIAPMINSGVAAWDSTTGFLGITSQSGKVIEEESQ